LRLYSEIISVNTMASSLKRKRGPVEVLDIPKRAKSLKIEQRVSFPISGRVAWEEAFNGLRKTNEPVQTNGINEDAVNSQRELDSPEAVDFDAYVEENLQQKEADLRKKEERGLKKAVKKDEKNDVDIWRLSEPIGGRMINADPVFTADEKYVDLFLIYGM